MVRIATFNVNGVNGRLPVLLKWLAETDYDIVCLQELKAYSALLNQGWGDALRAIHPEKGIYTYWNFAYPRGYDPMSGLRMDHLLISPSLTDRLLEPGVDRDVRSWVKPSDHAPAWIALAD